MYTTNGASEMDTKRCPRGFAASVTRNFSSEAAPVGFAGKRRHSSPAVLVFCTLRVWQRIPKYPALLHTSSTFPHRYDWAMESSLELVWEVIPAAMEGSAEASVGGLASLNKWGFLYTITASTILATFAGLSIKYLGFPGDLPNVIKCVHQLGYVPMVQTLPMICCSLFSIAAGGSLGPEAPLVAVSASACGWLSMNYFKHDMAMVRKCTIIGMSAGLSAFFGVQLGGK